MTIGDVASIALWIGGIIAVFYGLESIAAAIRELATAVKLKWRRRPADGRTSDEPA